MNACGGACGHGGARGGCGASGPIRPCLRRRPWRRGLRGRSSKAPGPAFETGRSLERAEARPARGALGRVRARAALQVRLRRAGRRPTCAPDEARRPGPGSPAPPWPRGDSWAVCVRTRQRRRARSGLESGGFGPTRSSSTHTHATRFDGFQERHSAWGMGAFCLGDGVSSSAAASVPGEYVMCYNGLEGRSSLLNRLLSLGPPTELRDRV